MNALAESRPRVLHLKQARDFERALAQASSARTPHFAIHHLNGSPAKPHLSTGANAATDRPVDETPPAGIWLGLVVPKRHAKRSVTRSLLKRQIREAVSASDLLRHGVWVVRLRSGFDKVLFPSAASRPLKLAARSELDQLLAKAARAPVGQA